MPDCFCHFLTPFTFNFKNFQSRRCYRLFFQWNKRYSVNMFLQSPDSSCLAWHPKRPRFPSFCTTVSRLILASSVFADIAGSESSWMALSEWHAGQNPQIKKSSQGSLIHAALSTVYIHRQQRHKSSTAHWTMTFNTHFWIVWKKSRNNVIQQMCYWVKIKCFTLKLKYFFVYGLWRFV